MFRAPPEMGFGERPQSAGHQCLDHHFPRLTNIFDRVTGLLISRWLLQLPESRLFPAAQFPTVSRLPQ